LEKKLTVPVGVGLPVWPLTVEVISIGANGVEDVALAVAVMLEGFLASAEAIVTVIEAMLAE
jgi:hypothetical protein